MKQSHANAPAAALFALVLSSGALAADEGKAEICPGRHLATIEADGKVSAGSREAVVAAARSGSALRIGWQLGPVEKPLLEHWQDARFITVFVDHVFAQIGDIHAQRPVKSKSSVDLHTDYSIWNASIGTDGRMTGRLSNEAEPMEIALRAHWCVAGV